MANGKKGALIIQGLQAGGWIGGIESAIVTSTSGDNLPGVTVPAAYQVTPQQPVALSGATYPGYTGYNPVTRQTIAQQNSDNRFTKKDWIFIAIGVVGLLLSLRQ